MIPIHFSLGILLLGVCHGAQIGIRDFSDYKVLRVIPATETQYQVLVDLHDGGKFDFWAGPSKTNPIDIMVDPFRRPELLQFFVKHNISHTTFLEDVGR